jgi:hypothetical protein
MMLVAVASMLCCEENFYAIAGPIAGFFVSSLKTRSASSQVML